MTSTYRRMFLTLIIITAILSSIHAQTDEHSANADVQREFFPSDLYCDESLLITSNYTWMNIHIGETTLNETQTILEREDFNAIAAYRSDYGLTFMKGDEDNEHPYIVSVCEINNIVTLLRLRLGDIDENTPQINSLIALLGIPDQTTWPRSTLEHRLAFWFESGLAVEFIAPRHPTEPVDSDDPFFGYIVDIFVFAPQGAEDGEFNWPYNRTITPGVLPPSLGMGLGIQNPVDYETLFADELENLSFEEMDMPANMFLEYIPLEGTEIPTPHPTETATP